MEEHIEILEKYLSKQDGKFVSENRFKFLKAIENLIDKVKEDENIKCPCCGRKINVKEVE